MPVLTPQDGDARRRAAPSLAGSVHLLQVRCLPLSGSVPHPELEPLDRNRLHTRLRPPWGRPWLLSLDLGPAQHPARVTLKISLQREGEKEQVGLWPACARPSCHGLDVRLPQKLMRETTREDPKAR